MMATTKHLRRWALSGVAALALLLAPGMAFAQQADADSQDGEPETVIVTATKRSTALQDVPFSINALGQTEIARQGLTSIEDISRNVAGLVVQNLGPGQSQVSIRGVSAGQIVRDQPGVKEQVGIYLDESVISLSLFTPDIDLFDISRVETLRGPQGTLFGSGSVGGTIRYITNQPNASDFSGQVEANVNVLSQGGVGFHGKGAVNIPIVQDKLAVRAVGYYTEFAGFIDALTETGEVNENVNSGRRFGGRVAVKFTPGDRFSFTPRILYQRVIADGFNRQENFNLFANPFTTTRPAVEFAERQQFLLLGEQFSDETLIGDAVLSYNFGPVELTSVSSYTDRNILVSRDASALTGSVSLDLGFPAASALLPSNLLDRTQLGQFTQEIRLTSTGDGRLQWLVGAYYANTQRNYSQRLPTPGYDAFQNARAAIVNADAIPNNNLPTAAQAANGFPANSPFNSDLPFALEQYAFFGEGSLDLTKRLTFTAGVRYYNFDEDRTITSGGLFANGDSGREDNTSSDGFTPRFILDYKVNETISVNAQAARGFRLGGVNDPLNVPLCQGSDLATFGAFQSFGDERLWNYELGLKAQSGGVTFNAAVFYTDISDLQVTLDAGSCSSRITFNVPEAHTGGVEFELSASPLKGLNLSVAGSILESRFDSSVISNAGAVLGGVESGNRLASVPEFQVAVSGNYSFPVEVFNTQSEGYFGFSLQYVGTRFTQPSDQLGNAGNFVSGLPFGGASGNEITALDLELDAYQILNINAGIDSGAWELSAYINNLLDENAQLAFDRERGGRARLGFATNQPRAFGVTLRRRF